MAVEWQSNLSCIHRLTAVIIGLSRTFIRDSEPQHTDDKKVSHRKQIARQHSSGSDGL